MTTSTGIILSILTPTIPSRWAQVKTLSDELAAQIGDHPVEHLVLFDNKRRSVGRKRDDLLRLARGHRVAFVDDDDWIAPCYIAELLKAPAEADVVTFLQEATINGQIGLIEFGLGNPNEPFKPRSLSKRNAWHVCAWRRTLAVLSYFPDNNYGEDWEFASKLCGLSGLKAHHIPKVLHYSRHDTKTSEALPGT